MQDIQNKSGFTLVELLAGLMIMSIVLAAVATLAFAMGSANDASDDTSQKQAQVRAATIRISELIRHSRLICGIQNSDDIALWRADEDGDDEIDINELVYIERTSGHNKLVVWEYFSDSCAMLAPILALSNYIDRIFIASSFSGSHGKRMSWGSHPELDPLVRCSQTETIHEGFDMNRVEKVKYLYSEPELLKHSRVCLFQAQQRPESQAVPPAVL